MSPGKREKGLGAGWRGRAIGRKAEGSEGGITGPCDLGVRMEGGVTENRSQRSLQGITQGSGSPLVFN